VSDDSVPAQPATASEAAPGGAFDLLIGAQQTIGSGDTAPAQQPAAAVFHFSEPPSGETPPPDTVPSGTGRRPRAAVPATGVLDWIAFALAFVAPPVGLLAAIAALVVGSRRNGWTTGIAKAAVAIGVVLTVVLIGGLVLLNNVQQKQAAFDAIVASSRPFCTQLRSDPATLQSPTYGWPSVQGTVQQSLPAMQKYEDSWTALVKIAPAGIRVGAQSIATAAQGIITTVKTSGVLDDENDVSQIQQAVSNSGISTWVAQYCN
jgi:hypothetical protein